MTPGQGRLFNGEQDDGDTMSGGASGSVPKIRERPAARKGDPDTSRQAAQLAHAKTSLVYRMLLSIIVDGVERTDEQLHDALIAVHQYDGSDNRVRYCRLALVDDEWLQLARDDAGEVKKRKTRRGRPSRVWVLHDRRKVVAP